MQVITVLAWYALAALAEIGGCFAFWSWLRLQKSAGWIIPGVILLIVFATALTRVDAAQYAGRTYAAYGGIYILASVLWLWCAEGAQPDRWDGLGAVLCLLGAGVILWVTSWPSCST